jgi:hypothetical protein
MKGMKRVLVTGAVVLAMGATAVTALAVTKTLTPAEILAGITGKPVETVIAERNETEQTYGALASDYGVLDKFQSQMLEEKKEYLEQRVAEGTMTQEQADAILAAIEANQANCDGTGNGGGAGRAGFGMGAGFGRMNGNGAGGRGCGGVCRYSTAQ